MPVLGNVFGNITSTVVRQIDWNCPWEKASDKFIVLVQHRVAWPRAGINWTRLIQERFFKVKFIRLGDYLYRGRDGERGVKDDFRFLVWVSRWETVSSTKK